MNELKKAKELLSTNEYTCVLCHGEKFYTSTQRGVKPLVDWLSSKTELRGFSAADKVVGKGAAFLYALLGVRAVYANVISRPALAVLLTHGIDTQYDTLAENIINRKGDGICPIESAVLEINEPREAYEAIIKKLSELNG